MILKKLTTKTKGNLLMPNNAETLTSYNFFEIND